MKKLLTLVCFAAASFAVNAQSAPKNALKINPVSALIKTGNISYERAIAKNQSLQLGVFYSGLGIGDFKYDGFGVTPEYRFYFGGNGQVLNGGYVAPFGRYQQFSIADKTSSDKAKFETIGGGAVLGWAKSWNSGFVLDIFAGPSYNNIRFKSGSEDNFDIKGGIKGFGLRTGVSIGFTF
ncbi:MAG TPA: DUF3575 domain-containing protein [Chitinophagaceae bacterium]